MTDVSRSAYWRSLEELEQSPQFQEFLHREFPVSASELPEGVSRRRWLQLMGASFALATATGCRWETERFAPLSERPEGRIPGKPEQYATTIRWAGRPCHLLVTNYEGRPIKVEGNPDHPEGSRGADAYAQAATLSLYDPDRLTRVLRREQAGGPAFAKEWADFQEWLRPLRTAWQQAGGKGVALFVEPTTSFAERRALSQLLAQWPAARCFTYDPLSRDAELTGAEVAFGERLESHLRLDRAEIIVCFDADVLGDHPAAVKHIGDFAAGRAPEPGPMNRLYVLESQFTVTGAAADHRLPTRSSDIARRLRELTDLVETRLNGVGDVAAHAEAAPAEPLTAAALMDAIAEDLVARQGRSVVAVGPGQPPETHAEAYRLNALLGNLDQTVCFTRPLAEPAWQGWGDLTAALAAGEIEALFVLGGNPAYDAPGAAAFADLLAKVRHTVRLGAYDDETARLCQWALPQTHPFEAWGDVPGVRGTVGVAQPLIAPLVGGRSTLELLALLASEQPTDAQQVVREALAERLGQPLNDEQWQRALHDGFVADSAPATVRPELARDFQLPELPAPLADDALEVVFTRSASVYDGSLANNAWLQESPDPLTKLTWDNAALLHPATAEKLGVKHGTLVALERDGVRVEVPAYTLPGQAPGSIGLAVGYGRTAAGAVGGDAAQGVAPVGANVNPLRSGGSVRFAADIALQPTGVEYLLATTQDHHAIDQLGLEAIGQRTGQLVREGTLDEYRAHPDFAQHMTHVPPPAPLWQEPNYEGRAWGMAIDLSRCVGCNACLVACQAENNVPVVGKDQVAVGREMHWLRIDRYFRGDLDQPTIANQPVACQQCENAPCEQVCPVAATVHSSEGLNDMVYNRCIGTRYCANNCPYKVRRFNFFNYQAEFEEPNRALAQLVLNPEVTVRSRGVMEKCTYCVQRISATRIAAKNEGRPIRDGEVQTACQQACPAQAIEFGDLHQDGSRVAAAHASPRAYGILTELNTKPRTAYLARIRNPHPRLAAGAHPVTA